MHTLHAVYIDPSDPYKVSVEEVKAVKAARVILGDSLGASLTRSHQSFREAQRDGYVLVGEHDDLTIVREAGAAMERLSSALRAFIDALEDDLQATAAVVLQSAPSSAPVEPTPKGYQVALILLGATDGNVNRTMEAILGMRLNTGNREWDEALVSLAAAHPWVKVLAQQTGNWPGE